MPDFFISHADDDLVWAEWVAAELENAGYGVIVKAWDFRPGENLLVRHDEALTTSRHTICVLTKAYLDSEVAPRTAAHLQQLQGKERALIPVRVDDCPIPPLMAPIIAIDLTDVEEADEARRRLLAGVAAQAERVACGGYPKARASQVRFPNTPQEIWELRGHRAHPHFIGREADLTALHRALRTTSPIQVIIGLGGLGKTRLVVEYAHRYAAAYDVIWWIRAEDPATMRADYVELAEELGLPSEKDDQAIAALRRELRSRRNWLLIFDNAMEPDELFSLLPERHSGHALITSQRREWSNSETRRLGILPIDIAIKYLQQKGHVSNAAVARDLADALGCLPLAVAQAATVIANGMSAADYLGLLHKQSPRLFAEGHIADHELTIDSIWQVSVDRLARRSPAAMALFRLAAFLSADAIPLARLTSTALTPPELAEALADPVQLFRATSALAEYSLAETADGMLSIHRLVQAVTRSQLGAAERHWASIALATITAAFPENETDPDSWSAYEEVLPHALACAGHATRLSVDTVDTMQLLDRVARYFLIRGKVDSASAVIEQAMARMGQLEPGNLVFLSCRNTYGRLLLAQGKVAAALRVQDVVYQGRMQALGPRDPDTLRAGRDLVDALYRQGHQALATQLLGQLVESFTATLGPSDIETLASLSRLVAMLYETGELNRAAELEQLVQVRARMLGKDSPRTPIAGLDLDATLREMVEPEDDRVFEEQVFDATMQTLVEGQFTTFDTERSVGSPQYTLSELRKTRSLKEQELGQLRMTFGYAHPDTLRVMTSLAGTLREMGELRQARDLGAQVLKTQSLVFGDDHPDTLVARVGLAATLREMGELARARVIGEQVVEARIRVLGEEHPDTVGARASLAATLREMGELAQARVIGEQVVEARSRALGEEHSQTIAAKIDLAVTLLVQGSNEAAVILLAENLQIALRVFGLKHTLTTETVWRLVQSCGPHELIKRRTLIVRYLSWLAREQPGQLTANQTKIKEIVTTNVLASKRSSRRKRKRR